MQNFGLRLLYLRKIQELSVTQAAFMLEVSPETYVNLMDQYHPAGEVLRRSRTEEHAGINRPVTRDEYAAAVAEARAGGLHRFDHRRASRPWWNP